MNRWTYLIPRLIILGLIALVVWLSIDPLLNRALVHHAQAVTGAKVEIGQLRSTISKNKVFLQDLQIADPRDSSTNVFQADMAYLDVSLPALLRKRIVITGGRSSEVRFGTPRTESGELDSNEPVIVQGLEPKIGEEISDQATSHTTAGDIVSTDQTLAEVQQNWLGQLQSQVTGKTEQPFQTPITAAAIAADWPDRLKETQQQLLEIDTEVAELRGSLETDHSNPLRQDYRSALANLSSLVDKANDLQEKLQILRDTSALDLQRLTQVQQTDRQAIEALTDVTTFDGDAISQLLLTRSQKAHVNDIVRWFSWFRDSVPDFDADLQTEAARGRNICLDQYTPARLTKPDFLVKELNLEGAGHFAGQYMNFAGKVKDFSTQPSQHDAPISFELRAQGKQHFVVQCELDRRGATETDQLGIQCPNLVVEAAPLGFQDTMLVDVANELKMQAEVKLRADGDNLSGELVFGYSNVSLHVDQLHPLAGGVEMVSRLNQELSTCDQFETRIALGGTLQAPSIQMTSNLGPKIATVMNRISQEMIELRLVQQRQLLNETSQGHIDGLTTQIGGAIDQLTSQLSERRQWLIRTREQISSVAKQQWPDIR